MDDVEALIADARTYIDAELSFQKSRAAFVGDSFKRTVGLAVAGAILALIAGIAVAVGLLIALTPLITAWGATALVGGMLLLVVYLLLRAAGRCWSRMTNALHEDGNES